MATKSFSDGIDTKITYTYTVSTTETTVKITFTKVALYNSGSYTQYFKNEYGVDNRLRIRMFGSTVDTFSGTVSSKSTKTIWSGSESYTYTKGTSSSSKLIARVYPVDLDFIDDFDFNYTVPALTKYTITYAPNGGSGSNQTVSQYYGKTITLKAASTFSRTGYTLSGWGTSTTTKTYNCGATYTVTANKTLYAIWTANKYTVTLNKSSGTGGTSSVSATYGSAMPSATMPTRAGYTFAGYYDASSGGTQYYTAAGTSARTWNKTAAATLYARWTVTTYTITYNLNGGTQSNPKTSYTINDNDFSLEEPTRAGYTFIGWTGSNGTTPQTTVTISNGSTGHKTYTANWIPQEYTITYNLNDGTQSNPKTSYNIETDTFTLVNPTRTNCDFAGWTGSNGTSPQTTVTIPKGSTGDKTYTANWTGTITKAHFVDSLTTVRCFHSFYQEVENPSLEELSNYYEQEDGQNKYVLTDDTTVFDNKKYYIENSSVYTLVDSPMGNPKQQGYYEITYKKADSTYDSEKTYYTLEAKGKSTKIDDDISINAEEEGTLCHISFKASPRIQYDIEKEKRIAQPTQYKIYWKKKTDSSYSEPTDAIDLLYTLTSDSSPQSNKTYFTRSGAGTQASPYIYTLVENPTEPSTNSYYECSGDYIFSDSDNFPTDTSYDFQVVLLSNETVDETKTDFLSPAFFPLDFNAKGDAVGFFRPAPDDNTGMFIAGNVTIRDGSFVITNQNSEIFAIKENNNQITLTSNVSSIFNNSISVTNEATLGTATIGSSNVSTAYLRTKTTKNNQIGLQLYDDGEGWGQILRLGAGGNTIVGAGESSGSIYSNNVDNASGTSENLYLAADNTIYLYTNCNTIGSRKQLTINTAGHLIFPNSQYILMQTPGSSPQNWNAVTLNASNQFTFGNGSYTAGVGTSFFDGNSVQIRSKNNVTITVKDTSTNVYTNGYYSALGSANATTTNSANLHISWVSDGSSGGKIARSTASSRKYKTEIQNLISSNINAHNLYALPVRQFKYKEGYINEPNDTRANKLLPGFIAEEVAEFYPVAAEYIDGEPEDWSFRYIVPPMLKLIQEQHEEIEQLKKEVQELKNK